MRFIKIATNMYPQERIENVNFNANINGNTGVEVKLFNFPETFQYTGQFASVAWDLLNGLQLSKIPPTTTKISVTANGQPVQVGNLTAADGTPLVITLADQPVQVDEIEWVDFEANINGQTGIEVRVSSDVPGQTRQFTGQELASEIYDILAALASNQDTQQAAG